MPEGVEMWIKRDDLSGMQLSVRPPALSHRQAQLALPGAAAAPRQQHLLGRQPLAVGPADQHLHQQV